MRTSLSFIGNGAVYLGKQGIIPTQTNVFARMDSGPQLSHQYIAGFYRFSAKAFDAASLCITVAAVFRTAACFFMKLSLPFNPETAAVDV